MIKCIAIDDEPLALDLIKDYIENNENLEPVGAFYQANAAIRFMEEQAVDLIFLDINMPDMSGMELARKLTPDCKIIFTTAYEEYALESYKVQALDYLVKPFDQKEFDRSVQKAVDYFELVRSVGTGKETCIFVKSDYRLKKIDFGQLVYVENIKDYVRFHMSDGRKIMSLMSLASVVEQLPKELFLKVHRSFVVSISAVQSVSGSKLTLEGGAEVPVSSSNRKEVSERLS